MLGNRYRQSLLDPRTFSVTWELVPGRGAREKAQENTLEAARQAARGGRVHAVAITDNPGGNPAILADALGSEILRLGIEPLIHFTCKDRNRNQLEAELYGLDRAGVRNLLVMSGDYPANGFWGRPAPVFDLDPLHTLDLISRMNAGLAYPGPQGTIRHQPSDFFAGAAVSPFKATEAEQMVQYFKLRKKVVAGAGFIITQFGFDARKFHEALQFMTQNGLGAPLVGNIFLPTFALAELMNQNRIPGCIVTDKLLAELDRERRAPDKGENARLVRAARMYAILKGMGFAGVHIGGPRLGYPEIERIIDGGEALLPEWQNLVRHFDDPLPGGFYLYRRDPQTGLNLEIPEDRGKGPLDAPVGFTCRVSRMFHRLLFEPGKNLCGAMRRLCRAVEGTGMEGPFHKLEHLGKVLLYDCRDCGDCALHDLSYLCPMSRCPKHQRNGACGGSVRGWCEVHPGSRRCIYVEAYARLKHFGEERLLDREPLPPCNWDLYQTSSWINYHLGRDHAARHTGIPENPK